MLYKSIKGKITPCFHGKTKFHAFGFIFIFRYVAPDSPYPIDLSLSQKQDIVRGKLFLIFFLVKLFLI